MLRFNHQASTTIASVQNVLQFGHNTHSQKCCEINYNEIFSASAQWNGTYQKIKVNNVSVQTTIGNESWGAPKFGVWLGGYSYYNIKADIYALRVYNRYLTDEELTQNYNLDVARYGI